PVLAKNSLGFSLAILKKRMASFFAFAASSNFLSDPLAFSERASSSSIVYSPLLSLIFSTAVFTSLLSLVSAGVGTLASGVALTTFVSADLDSAAALLATAAPKPS